MSITDELRHEVAGYPFRDNGDFALFEAIADRIDAVHESACAEAYGNGVMSVPIALDESAWVKLPKDADGEYIHIGDEMEGVDKYDSLKKVMGKVITVSFESDGTTDVAIQVWSSDGKSWHRAYLDPNASVYRHYHAPTVEDVLREFFSRYVTTKPKDEDDAIIAEYASKLQLREGA